jgi:mannosyl-3-phosphoglycerate phosphatase
MRPRSKRATSFPRIALFSDVDGTLLDTQDRLAISADDVARIAPLVDLILASSRTLAELAPIQRRLGLVAPLVAENGAVVSLPPRWRGGRHPRRRVIALGQPASQLRPLVSQAAHAASVIVTDQRDLLPDRGRSLRRTHSVCIRNWSGAGAARFLDALRHVHLEATRSGEWITITKGAHKGTGVRAVLDLARRQRARFAVTAGIGNAANDVPLLAAADLRLSVRNPRRGHHPELKRVHRVHLLSASGRRAWRETLDLVLSAGTT